MRRIVTLIVCLLPFFASAQTKTSVGLYAGLDQMKVMTETTYLDENTTCYAYTEVSTLATWYGQFFYERKWWETPLYLHAEYRGTVYGAYESSVYLGAAYCFFGNAGFLAIEPLAAWKQNQGFGGQLSVVGNWEWRWVSLEHYTDIWRTHKMQTIVDAYTEVRGYFRASSWLSLGVIGTSYYGMGLTPEFGAFLALKINL